MRKGKRFLGNTMWNFKDFSENTAVISEEGIQLTYQELQEHTQKLVQMIGERCLIFSLCKNTVGSLIGYTGCLNGNIVPLMLDSNLEKGLLHNLLETYYPKYIWLPEEMKEEFPDLEECYRDMGYVLLKTSFIVNYPVFDELALLLTTSGSTGSPKLVRQSYCNIKENAKSIVEYLELDATERPITTLPMNYTYGLSIINSHLMVGATMLLTEKGLMQKEFWQFFKEQLATSFGGVPYTFEMLDKLRFFRMELPSLRTMTQAGGKLSPELHRKFAEHSMETGRHFVVMYGQTEATARMSYLPWEKSLEKYGSMGIAIPGGKFSFIDVNGELIEKSYVVGELVYEGANVTLGYAECGEDLIKGDERFGKLVTGDMAKRDEDGFYYIVGRKKRFLKIFGNRVNLDEIDRMVKTKFNLMDFASAGVDDKMHLFITEETHKDAIRTFIAEKTGLNLSAFHIVVIDEIPKNEAGKTLYKELEKYYKS